MWLWLIGWFVFEEMEDLIEVLCVVIVLEIGVVFVGLCCCWYD